MNKQAEKAKQIEQIVVEAEKLVSHKTIDKKKSAEIMRKIEKIIKSERYFQRIQ